MLVRFAEEQSTSISVSALSDAEVRNYSQANGMASFDERHHANLAIAPAIDHRGCTCNFVWRAYVLVARKICRSRNAVRCVGSRACECGGPLLGLVRQSSWVVRWEGSQSFKGETRWGE